MVKWFYSSRLAKWITPLGTCHTITLGCFVLTEKAENEVSERLRLHETTHAVQFFELLIVGLVIFVVLACLGCSWWWLLPCSMLFYVWYLLEWFVRFVVALCDGVKNKDWEIGYKNTVFEEEAIDVSENGAKHKPFGFVRYYWVQVNK